MDPGAKRLFKGPKGPKGPLGPERSDFFKGPQGPKGLLLEGFQRWSRLKDTPSYRPNDKIYIAIRMMEDLINPPGPKGPLGPLGPLKKSLRSGIHARNPPKWSATPFISCPEKPNMGYLLCSRPFW